MVILNKLSALPAQVNDKLHACFCFSLMPTKKWVIGVSSPLYYLYICRYVYIILHTLTLRTILFNLILFDVVVVCCLLLVIGC